MNTIKKPAAGEPRAETRFNRCLKNTPPTAPCQVTKIFFKPDEVIEIRALGLFGKGPWEGWAKGTVSGYFDDPIKLEAAVKALDKLKRATGIYFTLNPVDPALLARANNRLVVPKATTTDEQVACQRWLLIDTDPFRPSGISATDAELKAAIICRDKIAAFLHENGFPEPIRAYSGNGGHLLYKLLDLPNTPEIAELKKQSLQALELKFGGNGVDIDQKVFNPSRITKLYGTLARKGDSMSDRPHRRSYLEVIPEQIVPVTLEQLQWFASQAPKKENPVHTRDQSGNGRKLDVEVYLAHYGIEVARVKSEGSRTIYGLRHCVFDPSHSSNESAIIQMSDEKLLYQCFHNSCQDRTWAEARERISGNDSLAQFCDGYIAAKATGQSNELHAKNLPGQAETQDDPGETDADAELWGVAEEVFPRIEFPEILPSELDDSLAQLARSIGMPARSLPGVCMAAVGAALGDRISVRPKQSWIEHLIFWFFDIRPSGEGKTPAMQALIKLFHHKQKIEHDYYDLKKAEFDGLSAKDRKETIPPQKPRGYIGNTLTVEGLRTDLETNKTGGLLIALTEASALISGQNEYKSKGGSDREAYIALHDGDPLRVLRANKSIYISNSRVQIIGGIQPGVFRKKFTSEDGIFLVDGTIFRGLYTYDSEATFDIDDKPWSEENEKVWTDILERAFAYSESQDTIKKQSLDSDAKELFYSWRNSLNRQKLFLPEKIRGFIPKAIGYSLRFAGVLHCIHKFHEGLEPTAIITREDMQRGIDGIMFYLGQAVDVVRLLAGEDRVSVEITDQTLHLAKTLEGLKMDLDSGRLAVGYIHKKFNETCEPEQKIKTARGMGSLLRHCKLTIPGGLFDSNGKQRAKCLQWDKKTNSFIETCLERLGRLETKECQGFQERDIEKTTSRTSRNPDISETSETLKNRRLASESVDATDKRDFRDIRDEFSKENKKPAGQEFEDTGAGCSDVDEDIL